MEDIWLIPIPPKIRVFLWNIVQRALPLGETLASRGISTTSFACTHCGDRETANHLFLTCPFARQVWNQTPIHNVINIIDSADFQGALKDSKKALNLPPTGMRMDIFFHGYAGTYGLLGTIRYFRTGILRRRRSSRKRLRTHWNGKQLRSSQSLAWPLSRTQLLNPLLPKRTQISSR